MGSVLQIMYLGHDFNRTALVLSLPQTQCLLSILQDIPGVRTK